MSVIHEALKRAERERSAQPAPQSTERPAASTDPAAATVAPAPSVPATAAVPAKTLRRYRPHVVAALSVSALILAGVFWAHHSAGHRPAKLWRLVDLPQNTEGPVAPDGYESPVKKTSILADRVNPAEKYHRTELAPRTPAAPSPQPSPGGRGQGEGNLAQVARTTPATDADPSRLNARAVVAFREGRTEEARRLLELAIRLDPAMPEAHNNFGMVLQSQGRRAEARQEYLRALALLPAYPEALNNLGLLWSEEGNQAEAVRSFEKALGSKQEYSSAHLNLAIVYDKLGKQTDAIYHYRRFLETAGSGEEGLVRRVTKRLRQ